MESVKTQNLDSCRSWDPSTSMNIAQRNMRIHINHCQKDENSWVIVVQYHNATTISTYWWSMSLSSLNASDSHVIRVVKSPWIIEAVIPCRSTISASTCPKRQQNIFRFSNNPAYLVPFSRQPRKKFHLNYPDKDCSRVTSLTRNTKEVSFADLAQTL